MSAECRNQQCGRPCGDFLCWDCLGELAAALENVPWLLDQLAVTELRLDRVSSGLRAGRRPDRPLPFNERAAGAHSALGSTVTTWVRHLCEHRGIEYVPVGYVHADLVGPPRPGERRVPPGYVDTAQDAARWLYAHVLSVRLDEAAGLIHRDITHAVEAGITLINPRVSAVYRGPCPAVVGTNSAGRPIECSIPLYSDRDDDFVTCPWCDTRHDVDKLESRLLVRVGGKLFTEAQLVRVLRELGEAIPRGTIASWIARDQIRPRAWLHGEQVVAAPINPGDRPMYRLDEVRKLRGTIPRTGGTTSA